MIAISGDEVGDRGDVLGFRQLDDSAQQRRAERDHQDRADIDREKIETGAGGESDRAEKRPGGAVDRQRQRKDQSAGAAALRRREAVAVTGDEKQEADVAEGGRDHAPVVQHRCLTPFTFQRALSAAPPQPKTVADREYSRIEPAKHRR
jgi:hypothetical protein